MLNPILCEQIIKIVKCYALNAIKNLRYLKKMFPILIHTFRHIKNNEFAFIF